MFSLFDTILIVILAGFTFYGLFFGLIRAVGTFVGVFVGAFAASRLYLPASAWIEPLFFGYGNLGRVVVFLIIFSLANRLTGLAFYLVDRSFALISIIPFLKTINRLLGAIFGFLAGALILGLVMYVVARYIGLEYWIGQGIAESKLAPMLLRFNDFLLPILPEVLKKLRSIVLR